MKSFLLRHIPVFHWATSIVKDLLHNFQRDFDSNYTCGGFKFVKTTYLVTGSNGGIGQHICKILLTDDTVDVLCQSRPQNRNMFDSNNSSITLMDFQYINSTLSILQKSDVNKIGHIFHVAGLMSRNERISVMHSVNCISPFGLTLLLIPSLLLSNPFPGITFVSSSSHIRSAEYRKGDFQRYFSLPTADSTSTATTLGAYATSKYNLLLLSAALEKKLSNTGIIIRSVHPGLVDTPMLRSFYFKSRQSRQPATHTAHAKDSVFHVNAYRGVFDAVLQRIRHRLLLSPEEGAIHVLRAALHQQNLPPMSDQSDDRIAGRAIAYFVNGVPAADRLAYSLQPPENEDADRDRRLSEQIQHCFEDAVRVLPPDLRKAVISRLRTAGSSSSLPCTTISSHQIDPKQRDRRIEAMWKLADEIDAICDDTTS